jgi:hypothetical protein
MKHLRLHIPEPCTVGWNNMQVTENGHYCSTCSKNIPELHLLSDAAIIRLYLQNEGEFCGRIAPTQLERIRIHETALSAQIGLQDVQDSVLKRMLVGGLIAFTLTSWNVAFAEKLPVTTTIIDQFMMDQTRVFGPKDTLRNVVVRGVITDKKTQEPLPFGVVYIEFNGLKYGCQSDIDGNYQLCVGGKFPVNTQVILVAKFPDYQTKTMELKLNSENIRQNIELELDENILIEGIIIREED